MPSLRQMARLGVELGAYGWRTGRWWVPLAVMLTLATAALAFTAKVVVPTVVYTLF